ncbi:MAG: hypothetical protein HY321_16300 [Armatimonadetes bacterium]|nr:hypothetical protein [Armatimonadota bacterium]
MDDGFIRRTYRTSAWVLLLATLPLVSYGYLRIAWSLAAGAALGLGVLRLFEWLVGSLLAAPRKRVGWRVALLTVLKLPVLAGILYLVVHSGWFNRPAFAGGVALIHVVIFLRAVGAHLTLREQERVRSESSRESRRLDLLG